jgi:hypothetical protein
MLYRHCSSNFALGYSARKFQEIQVRYELNGTDQLLLYVDDVNYMGDTINTKK